MKTQTSTVARSCRLQDSYFNQLDSWFETLDLGTQMPRNKKIVVQSVKEKMNHPIFIELCREKEIAKLGRMMED